ncbi:MAG: hypothetical protein IJJ13_00415 [Lachnospiraceae bacterium]|nr:hypothetical protein [Lachnospiraceae bacterium]
MGLQNYVERNREIQNHPAPQGMSEEQQEKRQQNLHRMHLSIMENEQKTRGINSAGEDGFGVDSMDFVMEETTFEERTAYYFEEEGLLSGKEERYQRISDGHDPKLEQFAEEHQNRSARKRKKSAKSAAQNFKKARELEAASRGEDQSPFDTYQKRDQIMRARMAGMIDAARVKATSAEDEKYRIAKAKLKCLTILHDQLQHLRIKEQEEDFIKTEKKLLKELNAAQKEAAKYAKKQADEKWRAGNGLNDPAFLEEKLQEYKKTNETVTMEDLKVMLPATIIGGEFARKEVAEAFEKTKENKVYKDLRSQDMHRVMMHPCYYVRRDKNGTPINKTEQKKADWNQKWFDAVSDKSKSAERNALLQQAYDRFAKMEVPDLSEVRKKGAKGIYLKDPVGIYSICMFSLSIDNMRKKEPFVDKYEKAHPAFVAKMDTWARFSSLLLRELGEENLADQAGMTWDISGSNFTRLSSKEQQEKEKEKWKDEKKMLTDMVAESYPAIKEAEEKEAQSRK